MSDIINGYRLITDFTNSDAGMCQWAFAQKNGHDYFIKQLLRPKYPTAATAQKLTPVLVENMRAEAEQFYLQRKEYYDKLRQCCTGNVVVVLDFFRENEFYYIITERMQGPFLSVEQVAKLSEEKKRTLLKAILYSIRPIHERAIVHSDLKPENILIKQTVAGFCTAKLIDFDSGFFVGNTPDEIEGDQRYFSPEAILWNDGRDVPVTVQSDIFALGLLFHQYWCGDFPTYNREEYDSASIALLNHAELKLNPTLPADIRLLISLMLEKYQDKRPTAQEAWDMLSGRGAQRETGGGFKLPTDDDL